MHSWFAILTTFIVGLVLMILPMPDWTIWLRPAWVLLILIYWSFEMPSRVSVGMAWFIGLIVDLLNGTLLGEHALAYTLVIYLVTRMHLRIRLYPWLQQGFSIFLFVLLYQFVVYCIQGFIGQVPASNLYWLSSLTSTILWPWLYILLRDYRKRLKIA
ncbi:MAG: rod shape-determining protein MreD [Gammaproteobacteria bacterium]|nr:rod shape-determining protein MreD [Gammaproteobacteria bacterium]